MALVLSHSHHNVMSQLGLLGALVFALAGFYRSDGVTRVMSTEANSSVYFHSVV